MKLLSNKLVMFSVVVAIVAAIVVIPQMVSPGKLADDAENVSGSRDYRELHLKIKTMGQASWNKQEYSILRQAITDRQSNNSISSNEAEQLEKLLNSNYFETLRTAIRQFCSSSVSASGNLAVMSEEISKIPLNDGMTSSKSALSNLIQNFRSAIAYSASGGTIESYTCNQLLDANQSRNYRGVIRQFQGTEVLNQNSRLMSMLSGSMRLLDEFEKMVAGVDLLLKAGAKPSREQIVEYCTVGRCVNEKYSSKFKK